MTSPPYGARRVKRKANVFARDRYLGFTPQALRCRPIRGQVSVAMRRNESRAESATVKVRSTPTFDRPRVRLACEVLLTRISGKYAIF
jgi:hypothetical protein